MDLVKAQSFDTQEIYDVEMVSYTDYCIIKMPGKCTSKF